MRMMRCVRYKDSRSAMMGIISTRKVVDVSEMQIQEQGIHDVLINKKKIQNKGSNGCLGRLA